MKIKSLRSHVIFVAVGLLLLFGAPSMLSDFRLSLLAKYLCFAILAIGIDLSWGYGGMLALGQGVFFGLGGYCMGMYLKLKAAGPGQLPDFMTWSDRLAVYGVDLRHTPSVETFCKEVLARYDRLDFILNNACQTVRRPAGFYDHLMRDETDGTVLGANERAVLEGHLRLVETPALATRPALVDSARASQLTLLADDLRRGPDIFPAGALDADLQQVDLRDRNSWRLTLAEVSSIELLEVHLVNAVAPFVLNARLKPLMIRHRSFDKHIVNVSAMEGQFYRTFKTDKHPHTNMAKAALNMMTRTSAADYVQDGIHMNSVDTGWITDEDPLVVAERKRAEHGFHPPLDVVDGAARIVDPIFHGFSTGEHMWGLFLKDYKPVPW